MSSAKKTFSSTFWSEELDQPGIATLRDGKRKSWKDISSKGKYIKEKSTKLQKIIS